MTLQEWMLREFREEAAVTRRVIDQIPPDKLSWKPHPKSMSLGQLAIHIARMPAGIAGMTWTESFDISGANFAPQEAKSLDEIQSALTDTINAVEDRLHKSAAEEAETPFRMMHGDQVLLSMPRAGVWRSLMLNHWYHHRGQLTVYLRLLDVAVPSVYGPSADSNPFAEKIQRQTNHA
jgi:uncharacterized damage-inducible protein DinB